MAAKQKWIDHLGNEFSSKRALCKHYGISHITFTNRLEQGWTLEQALTYKGTLVNRKYQVQDHLGNTFTSVTAMCEHYGISTCRYQQRKAKGESLEQILTGDKLSACEDHLGNHFDSWKDLCKYWNVVDGTIRRRLNEGMTLQEALEGGTTKKPAIDHLGNKFPSTTKMVQHYKISYRLYLSRKERGWPLEKILTTPAKHWSCIDHLGQEFSSQREMCKYWGVPNTVYRTRRDKLHMSLEEALTKPVTYYTCKDHLGNVFNTKREMCKHYNINPTTVNHRLSKGWTLEQALTIRPGYSIEGKKLDYNYAGKSICDHLGNEFASVREMCNHWNIPEGVYAGRVRGRGWSQKEALETPCTGRGDDCTDHLGNKFNSKKEMCKFWNLPYTIYLDRVRGNFGSLEKILTIPAGMWCREGKLFNGGATAIGKLIYISDDGIEYYLCKKGYSEEVLSITELRG